MTENQAIIGLEDAREHISTPQTTTRRNQKSGQEVAKSKSWPKSDSRHWKARVYRATYTHQGQERETTAYSVRIAYKGRRERFGLETANKDAAAEKAREIYLAVAGAGWEAALARFKPKTTKKKRTATVGELIETAAQLSSARPASLRTYSLALRRIASGVLGLKSRKGASPKQTKEWRDKVDALPLDSLTPAKVMAWKNTFLRAAKTPEDKKSAAVTVNSLLRNSRALLSKKIRPFIEQEVELPSPLWFEGVPREQEPSLRYNSRIDAEGILADAQQELAEKEPEQFKALLLTLVCGLRRSEADALLWEQVDTKKGRVDIRDTEHKQLKSADSAGVIQLDEHVSALLKGHAKTAKGDFVLKNPERSRFPHKQHSSRTYRCDATFGGLVTWLRSKGVKDKRPIHTLRKEIGAVIASRDGIYAASRYLRHSDIGITARLYADIKTPVKAGLGIMPGKDKKH